MVRVFLATAAILAAWLALTALLAHRRHAPLAFRLDLRPQHYVQACAHLSIYAYWASYWGEVGRAAPLILAQLLFADRKSVV